MKALVRDGHKCVLTGALDAGLIRSKTIRLDPNSVIAPDHTQAVHIFPSWSRRDVDRESSHATGFLNAMKRIHGLNIDKELDGHKINRLSNIITMCDRAAGQFNSLKLWFEADENEKDEDSVHHYKVCSTDQWRLAGMRKKVAFRDERVADGTTHPRPDRRYLQVHALCCRVAHLSGATEYLDKFYKKFERMEVLATDGSSADFLIQALELLGHDG
ncbi:uncharacterized protein EI90DRAFT_3062873 [Cantharellus anzutake]|uniref:uncharacterized protein n=1 Tax=Cantharellus anzutake TaxID=1750568 RepID=UPI001907CCF8|nr:uncharacterized protein EI90DRAFT_3062873 [Cantharellus anzutake]KAF8329518.1 hypothetical protein EI90DRAFT_3062873 [Cantharellus anzutake]